MKKIREPVLLLDGARGIYIPKEFAERYAEAVSNVGENNDMDILRAGPDHEFYWDAWSDVLDHAVFTSPSGLKWRLYQDGDLWLIPEGMEWSDEDDWFVCPKEDGTSGQDRDNYTDDQDRDSYTRRRGEGG